MAVGISGNIIMRDKLKHLFEDVYIGSDKYNLIVYERTLNTKGSSVGKEQFTAVSYHSNPKSLKHDLMRKYIIKNIINLEVDEYFKMLDVIIESLDKVKNDENYRIKEMKSNENV